MKKTISVTVNGVVFHVEEEAYEKLKNYLQSIKDHFSAYAEGEEIISDIESRIAEHLGECLSPAKQFIAASDVESLIKSMGAVRDFSDEAGFEPSETEESFSGEKIKKLYRDTDNAIIAGVASGIASYLGVEAVWARLVFALSVFFGGYGALLYLLLWLIMPEAKTASEKVEMSGKPVTLKRLEKAIKSKFGSRKDEDGQVRRKSALIARISFVADFIFGFFRLVLRVVRILAVAATKIFGLFALLASVILILGATFTLFVLAFDRSVTIPYIEFPAAGKISGFLYYALIFSGYAALVISLGFFLYIGFYILRRKARFNKIIGLALFSIWIVALAATAAAAFKISSYGYETPTAESPAYALVDKKIEVKEFDRVRLSGNNEVNIKQGDEWSVSLSGREKDIGETETVVKNIDGELHLLISGRSRIKICLFCSAPAREKITVSITTPLLKEASFWGKGKVSISGFEKGEMSLDFNGYYFSEIDVSVERLKLNSYGKNEHILRGQADELEVELFGSSNLYACGLKAKKAVVDVYDLGRVDVYATDELKINTAGRNTINYKGDPSVFVGGATILSDIKKVEECESVDAREFLKADSPSLPPLSSLPPIPKFPLERETKNLFRLN